MDTIAAIVVCIFYCIACLCLGAALIRLLAPRWAYRDIDNAVPAFGAIFLLGQGVLALFWQLLVFVNFAPEAVTGVLVVSVAAGIRFAWPVTVNFARRLWAALTWISQETWVWRIIGVMAALLLLREAARGVLPPQTRGDALGFYMVLPKLIAATHEFTLVPAYEAFTQIGLQGELHFAALMSLSGPVAAKLFVWPTSAAGALMLLALSKQAGFTLRGRLVIFAALYTSTAFTQVIWDGKVDMFGAVMGMAALYWAMQAGGEHTPAAVRLTGLFSGLAIVAKLSYLPILPPAVLLLLVWRWYTGERRALDIASLRSLALLLVSLAFWAALPLIPNAVKNAVVFDAPLAPFISPDSSSQDMLGQVWFQPDTTLRLALSYPLSLIYGHFWAQAGQMSPLILAFAPLLLLVPRPRDWRHNQLTQITAAGLLGLAVWIVFRPSVFAPRYILALLLALIPASVRGVGYVLEHEKLSKWLGSAAVVCVAVVLFISLTYAYATDPLVNVLKSSWKLLTDQIDECTAYGGNSDCQIASILNEEASPGARVFLGSYFRYWLRPDLIQCSNRLEPEYDTLNALPTLEARWSYLYERGFRYLIVDKITHMGTFDKLLNFERLPDWLEIAPVFEATDVVAYRFGSTDPAHQVQFTCREVRPNVWEPAPVYVGE